MLNWGCFSKNGRKDNPLWKRFGLHTYIARYPLRRKIVVFWGFGHIELNWKLNDEPEPTPEEILAILNYGRY